MKKHKAIRILNKTETTQGWEVMVAINQFTYKVKLTASYYQQLTNGKITPEKLVEASFKFLLDREKPEQILTDFYLAEIKQYFPNYETDIKSYL